MSGFKEPGFADRQKAAQEARKNILNKFRSQPGPDDPAVMQRQAQREAQAAERAKAKLARETAKAEQKRLEEEAAAEAAAKIARRRMCSLVIVSSQKPVWGGRVPEAPPAGNRAKSAHRAGGLSCRSSPRGSSNYLKVRSCHHGK